MERSSALAGPVPLIGIAIVIVYVVVFYDGEAEMYGLLPESVVLFLKPELTESEYRPLPPPPPPPPVEDFIKPLEPAPEQPVEPELPPVEIVEPLVPDERPPTPPQFTQPEQPSPVEPEQPEQSEQPAPPPVEVKPEDVCQYHGLKINSVTRRKCRDDNGCFWEFTGNSDREEKRGICKARQPSTEPPNCESTTNRWRCSEKQDCRWTKNTKCTTRPSL